MKLLTASLQFVNRVLGPSRQVNMDRGPHASTKVGWAGVDVAIFFIKAEVLSRLFLDWVLDSLDSSAEPFKDTLDITTHLHGDDAKLILFIDPDKEGFGIIMEDTSALWPVTFHSSHSEITIARHKEEVIINELLANILLHSSQRIVVTGEISSQIGKSFLHEFFNTNALLLSDSRWQSKSINWATNTDSAGFDRNIRLNIALDLGGIHVRGMLCTRFDTMVFLNERIKNISKVLIWVPVSSIDTTVLIVELNSTGNGLGKSKSWCLGLDLWQFIPFILGDMLGYQRMLGSNEGEVSKVLLLKFNIFLP